MADTADVLQLVVKLWILRMGNPNSNSSYVPFRLSINYQDVVDLVFVLPRDIQNVRLPNEVKLGGEVVVIVEALLMLYSTLNFWIPSRIPLIKQPETCKV